MSFPQEMSEEEWLRWWEEFESKLFEAGKLYVQSRMSMKAICAEFGKLPWNADVDVMSVAMFVRWRDEHLLTRSDSRQRMEGQDPLRRSAFYFSSLLPRTPWSKVPEEAWQVAIELYEGRLDLDVREICKMVGITPPALTRMLRQQRLPRRQRTNNAKLSEEVKHAIVEAHVASGGRTKQVAVRFGLNPNTVRQVVREAGIPRVQGRPKDNPVPDARLVELYANLQSLSKVGNEVGQSKDWVRRRLLALGVELRPPPGSHIARQTALDVFDAAS